MVAGLNDLVGELTCSRDKDITLLHVRDQGPISSTSLRRVFVLKTSYEVRTLKIGFHQTIEVCELLTFCRICKTHI